MGNQRAKYYCGPCDKVVKSRGPALCPCCGGAMKAMGTQWRPGRRGSRTRAWDQRQERPAGYYFRPAQQGFAHTAKIRHGRKWKRWHQEQPQRVPPRVPVPWFIKGDD